MLTVFSYLFIGVLAGTLSGLLGLGGGIIIVPSLVFLFENFLNFPTQDAFHFAIGTSLASIIIVAAASSTAHIKRTHVSWFLVRRLLPGLLLGAAVGGMITNFLPSHWLRIFFALFLFIIATRMFRSPNIVAKTETLPNQGIVITTSSGIGLLSGMLGTGLGAATVPFLVRYNVNMKIATATTVICTVPTAILGSIAYMSATYRSVLPHGHSIGYIYLPALAGISIASIICAPLGVSLATILPTTTLKRIFALFLFLICLLLLWRS